MKPLTATWADQGFFGRIMHPFAAKTPKTNAKEECAKADSTDFKNIQTCYEAHPGQEQGNLLVP
jgi:hypothetical protein